MCCNFITQKTSSTVAGCNMQFSAGRQETLDFFIKLLFPGSSELLHSESIKFPLFPSKILQTLKSFEKE